MTSKGINWDAKKDLLEWKHVAIEKQRFYYEFLKLRRWEMYEEPEYLYLKTKIGYALYGPPLNVKDLLVENFYSLAQKKKIEDIFNAMKSVNKGQKFIIAGFIFFISTIDNKYTEFPVFRVLKKRQEDGTESCCFVDSFGYVYKNWDRFLGRNIIPYCIYCYPKDGFYTCDDSGDVQLEFNYCPQSYSLFSGVATAVGTVGSAVGTVGSAVGTVLPVGRTAQSDLIPLPLISVIKGIRGRNKLYWIPVTSATGSADLYAIHCTQALAESSQRIHKISQLISDALEIGYVNIAWYGVLNQIAKIIQHSNKTSSTHVAQVITSALFFCHSVLSFELTKQIIKEVRTETTKQIKIDFDNHKKSTLQKSVELKSKNPNNPVVKGLKFIDDRTGLTNEIIENTFKSQFMIPDQSGKFYSLATLLDNIENSSDTKICADIIVHYILKLEAYVRNCQNCSKLLLEESKFTESTPKITKTLEGRKINQSASCENSLLLKMSEITTNSNLNNTVTENLSSSKNIEISSPFQSSTPKKQNISEPDKESKTKDINESNEWLLVNILGISASPLFTPPQKRNLENNIKEKSIETEANLNTPIVSMSAEIDKLQNCKNNEHTPIKRKNIVASLAETVKWQLHQNLKRSHSLNIDLMSNTALKNSANTPNRTENEIQNSGNIDENDRNMNTPVSKKYNKNVSEIIKNSLFNADINMPDTRIEHTSNINKSLHQSNNQVGGATESSEKTEDPLSPKTSKNENLSGKTFTVCRDLPEELAPLGYFKEYVQSELNNKEPTDFSIQEDEKDCWQYVMPEEVNGVKLVKINIAERSSSKEWINIKYY